MIVLGEQLPQKYLIVIIIFTLRLLLAKCAKEFHHFPLSVLLFSLVVVVVVVVVRLVYQVNKQMCFITVLAYILCLYCSSSFLNSMPFPPPTKQLSCGPGHLLPIASI